MPTGTGCNCSVITANVSYYEAAVEYEQAAIDLHAAQKDVDEGLLNGWAMESYRCGCGTTGRSESDVPPIMRKLRHARDVKMAVLKTKNVQKDAAAEAVKSLTGSYPVGYQQ